MATKSRNIRYASVTKGILAFLLWVGILASGFFGLRLLDYSQSFIYNDYFETFQFRSDFSRLLHNVVELEVVLIDKEHILENNDKEEVNRQLERLRQIEYNLESNPDFVYVFMDIESQEITTNLEEDEPEKYIRDLPTAVYLNGFREDETLYYSREIKEMLEEGNLELYAAVRRPLTQGDIFYEADKEFWKERELAYTYTYLFMASISIVLITFIYLGYVAGKREKNGDIHLLCIDRLKLDIHTLLVFVIAIFSMAIISNLYLGIGIFFILAIDLLIGLSYIFSVIRQFKKGVLLKNTWLYCVYKTFYYMVFEPNDKAIKRGCVLFLLGCSLINGILLALAFSTGEVGFLFFSFIIVLFNLWALVILSKHVVSLSHIMKATKEISEGHLDYELLEQQSVFFNRFAKDIQSIQGGFKKALEEAVKGERMKTDLITNVSHDLKTPLTSLVTYVDLLKRGNLSEEKREEYINILEEKSGRLKQLIEDLIEASKVTSGNLVVKKEKVDLYELIHQACGEYEEKIISSELDIRIKTTEEKEKIYVAADGKYMWRIVDNLLSNVVKYALSHTRVYIHVSQDTTYGILTIKNISSFPLDIPSEQLIERFVRGDISRTTEGSGLGLSIAESLTDAQNGDFLIEIDGDLFKVVVKVPLWQGVDKA